LPSPDPLAWLRWDSSNGRYGSMEGVGELDGAVITPRVGVAGNSSTSRPGLLLGPTSKKKGVPPPTRYAAPSCTACGSYVLTGPLCPYLFVSERGGPMTASNVRKLVSRTGLAARLPFPIHPHMLRHACGYKLAKMRATTPDHRSITWATKTSLIPCDTRT
jgi:hypothetical protein